MGREEGKRMRCHMRGFVPLGGHSPREEKEPLELPPLEASLAISITAAPEARWIDGVWHGEGQKHCMALPSLRSSASFSRGEPGGRKWEGWLPSDSSAHLSTSELEKSRGRYPASQGAAEEPHQISGQRNYSRSRQRALSSRQWHC